jgi:hypothetical protein
MSVVVRYNRATNPNVAAASTNWAFVAGTSGVGSGARNSGTGFDGSAGFWRSTWTTGTTGLSGGFSYTQTVLSANTQYTHSVYVRSSKAQSVRLSTQYQNSTPANVGSVTNGTIVALTANNWQRISVTSTSPAGADRVIITAAAATGGSNWANGDTFDGDCLAIFDGGTVYEFFDGSYTDAAGIVYDWSATANASTSLATIYTPVLALLAKTDAPTDRVQVTITDLPPGNNVVNLWRSSSETARQAVRGVRRRTFVTSDFVEDFEPPLNTLLTYELEIVGGLGVGATSSTATITLTTTRGWIQDPLDPTTAVPIYADVSTLGPNLTDSAIRSVEYPVDKTVLPISGSKLPMVLLGQRRAASDVSFEMESDSATYNGQLRDLTTNSPLLLIRPLPVWSDAMPGLCYVAADSIKETREGWGNLKTWSITSPLYAPPTMDVLVPTWTYGDVAALWSTYQQAQTAHTCKSYFSVKKSPTGA